MLRRWGQGDRDALEDLIPLVYGELHRIARGYFRGERAGHTLQPTALVQEAYIKLVDQKRADWRNSSQFFGVAAQLMRRILVDHARKRAALKRGGMTPVTGRGLRRSRSRRAAAVDQDLGLYHRPGALPAESCASDRRRPSAWGAHKACGAWAEDTRAWSGSQGGRQDHGGPYEQTG